MSRTVVILHPGGFGDLLLAVPAIRGLRERFPLHQIVLSGHAEAAQLLAECGLVDRWLSAQSAAWTALFAGMPPDDSLLRDCLSRCDVAVAWTRDDMGTVAAALSSSGAAAVVVDSPFAPALSSTHQSDRFIELTGGEAGQASVARLSIPNAVRDEADACLAGYKIRQGQPLAMVHPGSGSRHKCVTPAVLVPVLEGLEAEGLEPVLLEGPADHEIVEQLSDRLSHHPVCLSGLSVRLLAGVLARGDVFLGHDSGVTHLAALLGTPTVALFGPTDPFRWAPRGSAVTVISGSLCRCASWEAVKACVETRCLEISPETILAACRGVRAAV
ncbi:MAG TPA: glycosyltransferase family 9 protein [Nitrospira sp.]|nr:glycosyltransferase family 9 protein [Nitrospira sp.]